MSLFAELKRRNVIRVAVLYIVMAWVALQVADTLFGMLEVPDWAGKLTLGFLVLGFPLVLLFSWIYELTPEGLKKQQEVDRAQSITAETGRKINAAIGVLAVVAILVVIADRLVPREATVSTAESPPAPSSATVASTKSIAVLPFLDLSPAKDQEYFTDGISEELLNLLAKVPDMKVIGRTSSFQFKDKNEDLRLIGKKLSVAHILEGSVRKSGETIRVTAQLIRADDGTHLWSNSYDRKLDDVFAVQDDIAGEVVRALKVTLLGDALPSTSRTEDAEAHSLYLQGRFFGARRSPGDTQRSIDYYTRALERDPTYAAAWVGISASYFNQANTSGVDSSASFNKAREAARRAIDVDPDFSDGYAMLGDIATTVDWNWSEAERQIRRARELDPQSTRVVRAAASFAATMGRLDEAVVSHRMLTERDPLLATGFQNLALMLRNVGKLMEAEQQIREAIELSTDMEGAYSTLAGIQVLKGEPALAVDSLEKEIDPFWKLATLPIVLHAQGAYDEAERACQALIDGHATEAAFQIAEAHAFRGNTEKALEWMERAYRQRDPGLTELPGDPFLKSIEKEPRYAKLVRQMGLGHLLTQ